MSNQLDNAVYNVDFPKIVNPYAYQTLHIGGSQIDVVAGDNETAEEAEFKLYAFREGLWNWGQVLSLVSLRIKFDVQSAIAKGKT